MRYFQCVISVLCLSLISCHLRATAQADGNPASAGEKLTLVENGAAKAPIVVRKDTPPKTMEAANELAAYIEKISGAKPKVMTGAPESMPAHAIWVGVQPAVRQLFPDIKFDFQHPEEILIAADDNHLVIAGRDRWDPEHLKVEARVGTIHGKQREYGTANAVYTFLQKYLDVRWLWPGELGEDVIEQKTIAFQPFTYRHYPEMRLRDGFLRFSAYGYGGAGYGRSTDWVRRQRLQLDSLDVPGGHAFGDWWKRFHETHPEYFALQPDGTRSPFPKPHTVKMCHSNPGVWEQWLADAGEEIEEYPNRTVFNASPNDSGNSGHCICTDCRAWDHPDGKEMMYRWEGMGQKYVATSDRHVTFANHCSRLFKKQYPQKDYYVAMMAYGTWRPAPVEAVADDNVLIVNVASFFWWGPEEESPSERAEMYAKWGKMAKHQVRRPNVGSPAGWVQGFPDVPFHRVMQSNRHAAENNCAGIYIDTAWEHWATQGPLYYLMAQLIWNPSKDGDAILDEYYDRGFGPAAETIKAYWTLLEETRNTFVDRFNSWRISKHYDDVPKVYTSERLDRAEALLDKATAEATEGADIYRRRVAFIRAGFDYTRLAIETLPLIDKVEKSEGTDTAAKKKARQNWEKAEQLRKKYPRAVNWTSLGGKRNPFTADFLPCMSPRWRE